LGKSAVKFRRVHLLTVLFTQAAFLIHDSNRGFRIGVQLGIIGQPFLCRSGLARLPLVDHLFQRRGEDAAERGVADLVAPLLATDRGARRLVFSLRQGMRRSAHKASLPPPAELNSGVLAQSSDALGDIIKDAAHAAFVQFRASSDFVERRPLLFQPEQFVMGRGTGFDHLLP
jgi:hypothetical protein